VKIADKAFRSQNSGLKSLCVRPCFAVDKGTLPIISFFLAQSQADWPVQGLDDTTNLDDGLHCFEKRLQASKLDVVSRFRFLSSVLWPLQFVDLALLSHQNNYKTERWLQKFCASSDCKYTAGSNGEDKIGSGKTDIEDTVGNSLMRSVLRRVLGEV